MMDQKDYLNELFPRDDLLGQISMSIEQSGLPPISVERELGTLMTILVASVQTSTALEIGTLGGYSGTCIARGLSAGGKLTTLELKEEHAELARRNFRMTGFDDCVEIVVGEALNSLALLEEAKASFDFIFIDADKPNYPRYLDYALALSHTGTLIVADNVFLSGRVADLKNQSPSPVAMREFNRTFIAHPKLQATILPMHDGIAIARVL